MLELGQLREGLEHEALDASLEEPVHLSPEARSRLAQGGGAKRLDPDAEGADRACNRRPPACGPQGNLGRPPVQLLGAVIQPVRRELDRAGPEGVRLEDLCARPEVLAVDLLHELGASRIELIVADVHEYALLVEHRAHGAVHQMDPAVAE